MIKFYDPDGNEITGTNIEIFEKLEKFANDPTKVIVKREEVQGHLISTVWLHCAITDPFGRKPALYETMVFTKEGESKPDYRERYANRADAEIGHAAVVKRLLEDIALNERLEKDIKNYPGRMNAGRRVRKD